MTANDTPKPLRVALIGNPNTGKSTLFSRLCGVRQRTGNYPGVTVDRRIGKSEHNGRSIEWVDLPGTYSLVPRSPDEWVAVDVLVGNFVDEPRPDLVVCVLDANNLERNAYLLSQLLDFGIPVVAALNMVDLAEKNGTTIHAHQLPERLGIPVVETQAHRNVGIDELLQAVVQAGDDHAAPVSVPFPASFEAHVAQISAELNQESEHPTLPRFLVQRLLLQTDDEALTRLVGANRLSAWHSRLAKVRSELESEGLNLTSLEAVTRYGWIGEQLRPCMRIADRPKSRSWSDRIDRVLVHKVWGTLIFAILMVLVFQAIFSWAGPLMDAVEAGTGWLGDTVAAALPDGLLESLIVDGVIAGVGGVLVFLPQILILFFFIGLLEDCGYMARAAFLMDRLMARLGLSGKSFIPLLSSFACAIPGIMAARTIENPRDRLITILVAPLMSCSARLPVYTVLIAAFIPDYRWLGGWFGLQGMVMFGMYLIGIVVAMMVAFLLKRTLLRGESAPFLLELPAFKLPSLKNVGYRMLGSGGSFVKRAGTLILAVTVLVWAAATFPKSAETEKAYQAQIEELQQTAEQESWDEGRLNDAVGTVENELAAQQLRESFLGQAGLLVEPVVRPLGWDWKIGCAVIASFPAREVVIGTMGVIYSLGSEQDESSDDFIETLRNDKWPDSGEPIFNVPVALSIMVFFALCAQCASTLVVIRRETLSWPWTCFTFTYMTTLAYFGALLTYQVGMLWV